MEKLLTPEEAAERLAVKPHTIRRWLWRGDLAGVRVGNFWRVREQDLEAFIVETRMKGRKEANRDEKVGT